MPHVASSDSPVTTLIADRLPVTRDARLRHARRTDWRFLLPSPDLKRIALGGTPDDALREALEATSGTPTAELPASFGPGNAAPLGRFDTVVLSGRLNRSELAVAAKSVAVDGHLVVEIDGTLSQVVERRRGPAPGTASRLVRILAAGGFDVRVWWAWPTIRRATALVPLDDRVAVRALVSRRFRARRLGAPVASGLSRLARTSVLTALAPALIIVARRGPQSVAFIEHRARSTVGAEAVGAEAIRAAAAGSGGFLALTPRYRASAHVIGLGLGPGGAVERVAKVARLRDDTSLEHEAAVLEALGRARETSGSSPTLLDTAGLVTAADEDAWPNLVETGLDGDPLDPAEVRTDVAQAVFDIERWLAGLPVGDAATRSIDAGARIESALTAVERLADESADGRRLGDLVERSRPLIAPLSLASLPRVFEHGDPGHPNLLRLADGRIGAVDWERGEPDGLPLHDMTIALAYVAAAACDATSPQDQALAFRAAMTGDDPWAVEALDRVARLMGCDPGLRSALVVAAWIRSAGWLADRLAGPGVGTGAGQVDDDRQSATGLTTWLARDRSVAMWAVALDLAIGV